MFSLAVVPDVERVVERLQHGLQYDWHVGAWLQEDQLLSDDSLCGNSSSRLREGLRRLESHLVPVHTHALRVWGLRTLRVEREKGVLTELRAPSLPFPFVLHPSKRIRSESREFLFDRRIDRMDKRGKDFRVSRSPPFSSPARFQRWIVAEEGAIREIDEPNDQTRDQTCEETSKSQQTSKGSV